MRKFLLPIINLVNVILVSITFGLAANPAATDSLLNNKALPDFYNMVWLNQDKLNIVGLVAFFLFVVAAALTLLVFLPVKGRRFLTTLTGLFYIGSGVLFIMTPANFCYGNTAALELSGSLIAMAVLVFIAGALNLLMTVINKPEKKSK